MMLVTAGELLNPAAGGKVTMRIKACLQARHK